MESFNAVLGVCEVPSGKMMVWTAGACVFNKSGPFSWKLKKEECRYLTSNAWNGRGLIYSETRSLTIGGSAFETDKGSSNALLVGLAG